MTLRVGQYSMATVVNTINMAYDGDGHPLRTGENEYLYGQSAPAEMP